MYIGLKILKPYMQVVGGGGRGGVCDDYLGHCGGNGGGGSGQLEYRALQVDPGALEPWIIAQVKCYCYMNHHSNKISSKGMRVCNILT